MVITEKPWYIFMWVVEGLLTRPRPGEWLDWARGPACAPGEKSPTAQRQYPAAASSLGALQTQHPWLQTVLGPALLYHVVSASLNDSKPVPQISKI